jgi:hypothetical protein
VHIDDDLRRLFSDKFSGNSTDHAVFLINDIE